MLRSTRSTPVDTPMSDTGREALEPSVGRTAAYTLTDARLETNDFMRAILETARGYITELEQRLAKLEAVAAAATLLLARWDYELGNLRAAVRTLEVNDEAK